MAADISAMVQTSPVEVEREIIERFKSLHPQHGAWTWFVRAVLKRYVDLHTLDEQELIELAVREVNIKNS